MTDYENLLNSESGFIEEITADELHQNPELVRNIRSFGYNLKIPYNRWSDFIVDLDWNAKRLVVNCKGQLSPPDLSVLLPTDEQIDSGDADGDAFYNRLNDRFRNAFCRPLQPHVVPYFRTESRPLFAVVSTVIIAAYPFETDSWPRRYPAANDNEPVLYQAANDNEQLE